MFKNLPARDVWGLSWGDAGLAGTRPCASRSTQEMAGRGDLTGLGVRCMWKQRTVAINCNLAPAGEENQLHVRSGSPP
jgi:hypothetical protein